MKIEAHGMVIVYEGRLLVSKDNKDDFYKIPGGKINDGETGEETAIRELREETGLEGIVGRKLPTMILEKNPTSGETQRIELYHYEGKLKQEPNNFDDYSHNSHEIRWIPLSEIDSYNVAPNIKFLLEKGELKNE